MKSKLLSFFLTFFFSSLLFSHSLTNGPWKVEVEKKTGRFVLFYQNIPVNYKDIPITSFVSIKLDKEIYHLGKNTSVQRIEKKENSLNIIYSVTPQLLVEMILSFKENPFVYDDFGLSIVFRVDSRTEIPKKAVFRYLFDTAIAEEKGQGYKTPDNFEKELLTEQKIYSNVLIFYPFFIQSKINPSYTHLSSWQRFEENFMPEERNLLNFRDIRSTKWDPAIAYFYNLGTLKENLNNIEFFVGLWQKPNRNHPKIKIFYPQKVSFFKEEIDLPFLVENTGDFDIDFIKLSLFSPLLKQSSFYTLEHLAKGEKKELNLQDVLLDLDLKQLEGSIKAQLWIKENVYEQGFAFKIPLEKKAVDKINKKEELKQEKIEAQSLLGIEELGKLIEKINLLLYFVNQGLETGISKEMLLQIQKEVLIIENNKSDRKTQEN